MWNQTPQNTFRKLWGILVNLSLVAFLSRACYTKPSFEDFEQSYGWLLFGIGIY